MPPFLHPKSKSKTFENEGERLQSSPQDVVDLKVSTQKEKTEEDGSQLYEVSSKELGEEKEGSELNADAEIDDGVVYPGQGEVAIVTIALVLSVFIIGIDQTIIATVIPRITDQFNSLDDVGWYGSSYLLTSSSFQLFFGRLYVLFPVKWVFVLAVGLFAIGSLIAGAAPTSAALIVGRAISGLGCGGVMSGGLVIIAHTVPLRKRPVYTGIVGGFNGVASVIGPLLGGAFTKHLTWRWCFYINLPISGLTIALIVFFFKDKSGQTSSDSDNIAGDPKPGFWSFDPVGTFCLVPAIICLLLALEWGGSEYAWSSGRVVALLVVFVILILGFVVTQYIMQNNATLPPRIIKQRSIAFGAFFAFCSGAALFVMMYYLPMYFQVIKGTTALKSGIDILPLILSLSVMSILVGGFVTAIGYYVPAMILGSILKSVGAGLITTWTASTNHELWIGSQIIFGFGGGLGVQQAMIAAQTVLPIKDLPFGIAVVNFAQTMGGAVFLSVAQNVFANKLVSSLKSTIPDLDPLSILNAGATNIRKDTDPRILDKVLLSYNHALSAAYLVATVIAALTIVGALGMEWRSVKSEKDSKSDAKFPEPEIIEA